MVRWSRWALGLSAIAGLAVAFWVYSNSPQRVPVHFTLNGLPDAWGSPIELLVVQACVIGLCTALCLALPALIRRTPPELINLPHKEYWLAPERRDAFNARMAFQADLFGVAVNGLMTGMQLALRPGHVGPSLIPVFLILGFLGFAIGSSIWALWSYRMPATAQPPTGKPPLDSRS